MSNITTNNSDTNYAQCDNTASIAVPFKVSILSLVLVVGPLTNILIIILVLRYQRLKKNINYLIANMAVSDLMALLLGVPQWLEMELSGSISWKITGLLGSITCKVFYFVFYTVPVVSLLTLLIISLERYRAVTRSSCAAPPSRRQIAITILISWLIPLLMFSSSLHFFDVVSYNGVQICRMTHVSLLTSLQYAIIQTVLTVLLFVAMLAINVMILKKLRMSRFAANLPEIQRKKRERRIIRAVCMVLFSLLLYSICLLPANILELVIAAYWYYNKVPISAAFCINWNALLFAIYFLFYVNFTASPFIYVFFLEDFNSSAKKLLCCGTKSWKAEQETLTDQPQIPTTHEELKTLVKHCNN
ncbi:predicted protein [Nematostella vectensis]|uniref:G-protein coupled receptors family 1 profile domain-containing protein n=1 Tax=Nematostella vectensis TaxID=45351 RepID=A7S1R1_NEMVE|nr:predicted protein [Nematostella vectensis]|eukprot:XP_001634424.1 predicted protein [Nematostella vectensis]